MKKLILSIILLFIPFFAQAQTCPFGLTNDPAPGSCGRFIDENKNQLCDLSELPLDIQKSSASTENPVKFLSEEELKKNTVSQVAEIYGIDADTYAIKLAEYLKKPVNVNDSLQGLHDTYGLCSGVAAGMALDLKNVTLQKDNIKTEIKNVTNTPIKNTKNIYSFFPVIIFVSILYLVTLILSQKNIITQLTHRRIWNIALLLSFLAVAILGILLVIRIMYGWSIKLPFNTLYVHVEAGIIMTVISIIHIIWHWQYYTCIFKSKDKCKKNENQ